MSKTKATYYYKEEGSDAYHWETSCSKNHYPDEGWVKSNKLPYDKTDQCNQCKSK